MTADLSGIRSLLAGITPGPWFANRYYVAAGEDRSDPDAEIAKASFKADAAFIAAAPSTVARLLARLDAALTSVDELMEDYNADVRYADLAKIRAALTGDGA